MGEAFDSGFNSYKGLVGKLFSDLDLSGITQKADVVLASKANTQLASNAGSLVEVSQPALEVPAIKFSPKIEAPTPIEAPAPAPAKVPTPTSTPAEILTIEVILLEDDLTATFEKAS